MKILLLLAIFSIHLYGSNCLINNPNGDPSNGSYSGCPEEPRCQKLRSPTPPNACKGNKGKMPPPRVNPKPRPPIIDPDPITDPNPPPQPKPPPVKPPDDPCACFTPDGKPCENSEQQCVKSTPMQDLGSCRSSRTKFPVSFCNGNQPCKIETMDREYFAYCGFKSKENCKGTATDNLYVQTCTSCTPCAHVIPSLPQPGDDPNCDYYEWQTNSFCDSVYSEKQVEVTSTCSWAPYIIPAKPGKNGFKFNSAMSGCMCDRNGVVGGPCVKNGQRTVCLPGSCPYEMVFWQNDCEGGQQVPGTYCTDKTNPDLGDGGGGGNFGGGSSGFGNPPAD
jgi:hypothetical protein